ncbi:sulfotransferase [Oscillatoria sp. CS-180]|uniref:sulfotransferase family protein n=1 Tax=Oscillatoria sp. CS-180 TaxID=3021720 RepID=UPI00232CCE08|nr:sulfotransferase [Oscillatoria sp. CS-180]MDB9528192.1 sulfotransferase [Oscillatoria sp. CS-180]
MNSAYNPFFIVGCPRSGTTLLQVLLDSHPHVCIPPESFIFTRFSDIFQTYGDLQDSKNLKMLIEDLLTDERIKEWKIQASPSEVLNSVPESSVQGAITALFETYARQEKKSFWGDKTPQHTFNLDEIKKVFPEAKIIHLVRDGRDVAESLNRVYLGPKSIYKIAKYWNAYISAFREFKKNHCEKDFIEIQYEDLTIDPNTQVQRIFSFLNIDATEINFQQAKNTDRKEQYHGMAIHHQAVTEPVSRKKVGVFKTTFSERQIAIFETIAGDSLEAYGYPLVSSKTVEVGPFERIKFFWQDYVVRYARKFLGVKSFLLLLEQLRLAIQLQIRKFLRSFRY